MCAETFAAECGCGNKAAEDAPIPSDPRVSPLKKGLYTPSDTPEMAAEGNSYTNYQPLPEWPPAARHIITGLSKWERDESDKYRCGPVYLIDGEWSWCNGGSGDLGHIDGGGGSGPLCSYCGMNMETGSFSAESFEADFTVAMDTTSEAGFRISEPRIEEWNMTDDELKEYALNEVRAGHGPDYWIEGDGDEDSIRITEMTREHPYDPDKFKAESFGAESAFDRLEDEVADEYEEKGMSDKEAQKVGAAVAYKQGVKKYGKKIMSEAARKGVSAKSLKRAEIGPHVPTRIGATTTQRGVVKTYDSIPAGDGHVVSLKASVQS